MYGVVIRLRGLCSARSETLCLWRRANLLYTGSWFWAPAYAFDRRRGCAWEEAAAIRQAHHNTVRRYFWLSIHE